MSDVMMQVCCYSASIAWREQGGSWPTHVPKTLRLAGFRTTSHHSTKDDVDARLSRRQGIEISNQFNGRTAHLCEFS